MFDSGSDPKGRKMAASTPRILLKDPGKSLVAAVGVGSGWGDGPKTKRVFIRPPRESEYIVELVQTHG